MPDMPKMPKMPKISKTKWFFQKVADVFPTF